MEVFTGVFLGPFNDKGMTGIYKMVASCVVRQLLGQNVQKPRALSIHFFLTFFVPGIEQNVDKMTFLQCDSFVGGIF